MLYPRTYRNHPKFVLRRLDTMMGHVNAFLAIVAIGLGAFDLLCAARRVVESLPLPPAGMQ